MIGTAKHSVVSEVLTETDRIDFLSPRLSKKKKELVKYRRRCSSALSSKQKSKITFQPVLNESTKFNQNLTVNTFHTKT